MRPGFRASVVATTFLIALNSPTGCGRSDGDHSGGADSGTDEFQNADTDGSDEASDSAPDGGDAASDGPDSTPDAAIVPDGPPDQQVELDANGEADVLDASPDALQPVRKLKQLKAQMIPVFDATGVAHDGQNFWILSGKKETVHKLVMLTANNSIGKQFEFPNLLQSLGTAAYGITWTPGFFWISVSGNTNKLVKVDAATGAIVTSYGSPTVLGPSDLDFDGTNLWLSSGTGHAYEIELPGMAIVGSFAVVPKTSRDVGIARRPGEVWVAGLFGGMYLYNPSTGSPLGDVTDFNGQSLASKTFGPMCFVSGELVVLEQSALVFYAVL